MISNCIKRFLSTSRINFAVQNAEKSLLATLRKKTGYTFANCKKALELHNNDIAQAEKWLKDQAQAMGWSKATKLEGRQTKQGLVAVAIEQNHGALIEINCETDFVARNKTFQDMVENAAKACLQFSIDQKQQKSPLLKMSLETEQLKTLVSSDGKTLGDHLALAIGSLGENASLRRAFCFKGDTGVKLTGYAHPSTSQSPLMLGRFGAILAYKSENTEDCEKISRQLCQHIVGMNPKKIGNPETDEPNKNSDEETCLIYQDFVMDESYKVKEILNEYNIDIVDFKRIECGEVEEILGAQKIDHVETCQ